MAELPDTVNNRLVPRLTAPEFIQNADNTLVPDPPILVLHGDQLRWQSSLFLGERRTVEPRLVVRRGKLYCCRP